MLRTADADRSVVELPGLALAYSISSLSECDRQVLAGHDDDGEARERRDHLQVLLGVVAERFVEREIGGDRAGAAADQRVAVGRRLRAPRRAGVAAGAGAVFDDDRLPHVLRHLVEHDAADHVAGAAAGERDDHRDRLGRIALRAGDRAAERAASARPAPRSSRFAVVMFISLSFIGAQVPVNFAGRLAWNASTPSRKSSDCRSRL